MTGNRKTRLAQLRATLPWLFLAAVSLFLALAVDRYLDYARPFVRFRVVWAFVLVAKYLHLLYCIPAVVLLVGCMAVRVRWLRHSWSVVIASILLFSVHLLFAYVILWAFPPRLGEPIPTGPAPELRGIIEQADRATLYSIWPGRGKPGPGETESPLPHFEGEFHRFPVLGKVELIDAATRSRVLQSLLASVDDNFEGEALCFEPRHALRLGRGTDEVDLLICYHCGYMNITSGNKSERVCLSSSSKATLNRVLRAAGIKLASEDVH